MGQSGGGSHASKLPGKTEKPPVQCSVFATPLGWMAMAGQGNTVAWLLIGHPTEASARERIASVLGADGEGTHGCSDWLPSVRCKLEQFALGDAVDFSDVTVETPAHRTDFQRRVLQETRKIAFGRTVTYAELAARAGRPGAARAVGNVMATNRVPIIIPCHRVVAAGKLGGYSAPRGVELKKQILQLEAAGLQSVPAFVWN